VFAAGDPHGEVRDTWHAKQVVRSVYDTAGPRAEELVCALAIDARDRDRPFEVRSLGRSLARWCEEITNWH